MEKDTNDARVCPECGKEFQYDDGMFTRDCHGIEFRFVCYECYKKIMEHGYDGEYYDESDECLDYDY